MPLGVEDRRAAVGSVGRRCQLLARQPVHLMEDLAGGVGVEVGERAATEQTTIEAKFAEIAELDSKIEKAVKSQHLMGQLANLGRNGLTGPGSVAGLEGLDPDELPTDGQLFSETQKSQLVSRIRSKGNFSTLVKAPTLGGSLLPTLGSNVSLAPNSLGGMALSELFEQAVAEGPTVRVYKMSTGSAAVVAEGALKPDAGVVTTAVDTALKKIAATFQISDELVEDAPFLIASIQRQVTLAVLVRENIELVSALSGASGAITSTGTKAAAIDVLAAAIGTAEGVNGVTPSAILMAPADVTVVRQAKASTGGSYYVDPLLGGPTTLHGVPLISTPAVPSGTAYLVTNGAGLFYRRGALRVESGFSGDDFSMNLVTVRVEERVLPVVVRGELVSKITLT